MRVNSIIFHTTRLPELRAFYEGKLGLPTGTYEKDGKVLADFSDSYVNYHLNGVLLCFENDGDRTDLGTVVLNVDNFAAFKSRMENEGLKILSGNAHFFKIKDPEGRSMIIEPLKN